MTQKRRRMTRRHFGYKMSRILHRLSRNSQNSRDTFLDASFYTRYKEGEGKGDRKRDGKIIYQN